jgi:periplasmic protein TonB
VGGEAAEIGTTVALNADVEGAMSATSTEEAQQHLVGNGFDTHPDRDARAFVRWSIGAAVAILAHGLVGTLMLRWPTEVDAAAPTATIVIELSPVVSAPQVQETQTPPVPEQVQAENSSDKVKEIEEEPRVIEETFEPKLEMFEPRLEMVPVQLSEARRDVERVEPPSQKAPIVVIEEKSEVELPRLAQENDGKQTDAPRVDAAGNKPHEQKAQPKPVKPAPNKPQGQAPNRTATKRQMARARAATTSQAPAASTPSNSDALPNWRSQIIGILERNKRYPPEAEARQEHGVSNLAFSLNRQGRVTSARIAGSSGSSALDAETLSLVHRVQPFPPPPPEVVGAQVSLIVAIRYNPRSM